LGKFLRKPWGSNGKRAGEPTLFLLFLLPVGLADFMRQTLLRFHFPVNWNSRRLCGKQSDKKDRAL
jgi:hemolysin-activating ACP:hemolysin acyltransferase